MVPLGGGDEGGYAVEDRTRAQPRRVPLVGDRHRLDMGMAGPHRGDRLGRQEIRILAAQHQNGNRLQRAEFVPKRGHRLVEFDPLQGVGKGGIVVADRMTGLVAIGEAREGVPVRLVLGGELAAVQPPLDSRGVGPVVRYRAWRRRSS